MSRYYVGLACTGHDNAIAIVDPEGRIVFAEAAERYLQNKRALGYSAEDHHRVLELVKKYCAGARELVVAKSWSEDAESTLGRIQDYYTRIRTALAHRIHSQEESALAWEVAELQRILSFVRRGFRDAGLVIDELCREAYTVIRRSYEHHLTHAAAACFTGPKDEAVCAVVDGFGEGRNTSLYAYKNGRLDALEEKPARPGDLSGLGLLYAAMCSLCGFDPWQGEEWKVMGLAAYGKVNAELYDLMSQCLAVQGLAFRSPVTRPRAISRLRAFARLPGASPMTAADLACTTQAFFSDRMCELLTNLHRAGISDNLVLSGGCALNSSLNGQILARTPFTHLSVFAAPADDGNAVGAALLAYYEDNPFARRPTFQSPYLGSEMSTNSLSNLRRFQSGLRTTMGPGFLPKIAELLSQGKVVGWVQGRAEFGPRALGNRSILADPRRSKMRDWINEMVKGREEFRPLAPSILHDYGPDYFVNYQDSPYMERTLQFREEAKAAVPAVVHVDGTGRVHTVKRERNERYYDLLHEFHQRAGVPLLLNTSFNVMGKPIVHSVEDCIAVLMTSAMDVLVVDDVVFEKSRQEEHA
jgi:carbamoyltransferase